ncbi:hypothetical protein ACFO0N_06905 [Halobium salinum]|uniref:DUF7344 domain-containing protein n=1 Tax=Halobium salinum TaxID=1364940 RepID=A0ABD5P9V6_9EURY|nr:hypothetical protein [Halobium salinum]
MAVNERTVPSGSRESDARVDQVAKVLTDARLREVLDALSSMDDRVHLDALAERLRARGHDDCDDVAARLHHVHLPRLADIGVIAYDAAENRVEHQEWRVADVLSVAGAALGDGAGDSSRL